jgi:hypothetical protein
VENTHRSLDPSLKGRIGLTLEALINLLYLAKREAEGRERCCIYLELAEQRIAELRRLTQQPTDTMTDNRQMQ